MSYEELYDYAFNYSLLPIIDGSSDALSETDAKTRNDFNPIFKIASDDYYTHSSIVSTNEYRVLVTVAAVIVKILQANGSKCALSIKNEGDAIQAFILNLHNKKICVFLCFFTTSNLEKAIYLHGIDDCFDEIIIVSLTEPKNETANKIIHDAQVLNNEVLDKKTTILTIREFFEEYISEEAYVTFLERIAQFNDDAQNSIGLKSTVIPTDKAIEKFRKTIVQEIAERDYSEKYKEVMGDELFEAAYKNYVDNKRYMAMGSKLSFAGSFLSSEWNYKIHQITDSLDQTGIVAGYLKSVEQLLYELISFSKDEPNRKIAHFKDGKSFIASFTTENEAYVNSALNKLENFISYNTDLIHGDNKAKSFIIDALDDWRVKYRNGYFHKDNLNKIQIVEEIRTHAINLYFLLLGSWKLDKDELRHLGVIDTSKALKMDEQELFNQILNHLRLKKNWIPKGAKEITFWLHERNWNPCEEVDIPGWVLSYSFLGDGLLDQKTTMRSEKGDFGRQSFEWDSSDDWEITFEIIENILKKCMCECFNQNDLIESTYLLYDNPFTKKSRKEEIYIKDTWPI